MVGITLKDLMQADLVLFMLLRIAATMSAGDFDHVAEWFTEDFQLYNPEIPHDRAGHDKLIATKGEYASWRATRASGDFDLRTFSNMAVVGKNFAIRGVSPGR
jgi:hypothetical protein